MDTKDRKRDKPPTTVFGDLIESPPTGEIYDEAGGIIRGIVISTGVFVFLVLFIVLLGQWPPRPDLAPSVGTVELEELQAEEEAILNNYSWVDEQDGVVRIPIKEAMKIIEDRGLPARETQPGDEKTDQEDTEEVEKTEAGGDEIGEEESDANEDAESDAETDAEDTEETDSDANEETEADAEDATTDEEDATTDEEDADTEEGDDTEEDTEPTEESE